MHLHDLYVCTDFVFIVCNCGMKIITTGDLIKNCYYNNTKKKKRSSGQSTSKKAASMLKLKSWPTQQTTWIRVKIIFFSNSKNNTSKISKQKTLLRELRQNKNSIGRSYWWASQTGRWRSAAANYPWSWKCHRMMKAKIKVTRSGHKAFRHWATTTTTKTKTKLPYVRLLGKREKSRSQIGSCKMIPMMSRRRTISL